MSSIRIEHPEKLFFTADLHFSHNSIIGHCQRPFQNPHHMDESLIANWNALVRPDCVIYILGDMFWKQEDRPYYEGIMQRLNGEKHLIRGNHDYFSNDEYLEMGFASVADYVQLRVENHYLACFHYPILEWAKFYRGSWHLHGHSHGNSRHFSMRVLDVGIDTNHYFPYSWKDIKGTLSELSVLEMAKIKSEKRTCHCPYDFE